MREAVAQAFFAEGGIVPLTITYEDFILRYAQTVLDVLTWLGIPASRAVVAPPAYKRLRAYLEGISRARADYLGRLSVGVRAGLGCNGPLRLA